MVGRQSKFLVWINFRVRVTISDTRMLIGTFLAFDKHMNLVLSDTEEYTRIKGKKPGEVDREKKRSLGLVLLRGENIISMSAESPPSQTSKRFADVGTVQEGKAQPIGRGQPVSAPTGLQGPGRGIGVPGMMNMVPTMGRGQVVPGMMPTPTGGVMPRMPVMPPTSKIMRVNFLDLGGQMVRPPMMQPPMMGVRPPMSSPPNYNQGNQNQ